MPAQFTEIDLSGAFTDATDIFTLPATMTPWHTDTVPQLDFVYFDALAALDLFLYFALPGGATTEARRTPIIRSTTAFHELVPCMPWPVAPVAVQRPYGTPWVIRAVKAAGAANSAFLKLQWSIPAGC